MVVRYIGIDQSITSTGLVIIDYDMEDIETISDFTVCFTTYKTTKFKKLDGHIQFKIIDKKLDSYRKIIDIVDFISPFLKNDGFDEVYVAIEGYAYGVGASSRLVQLGELAGSLKYCAVKNGCKVITDCPKKVKVYATGCGNGKKEPMYEAIKRDASNCPIAAFSVMHLDEGKVYAPLVDVTDAYYIAKMVRDHHRLRIGAIQPEGIMKKVFYKKTPTNPPLIDQKFLGEQ